MALRHFGRLDVVVNVAGGLTTYGPIEPLTAEDIDREVAINLKTTVLVSQAAIAVAHRDPGLHRQLRLHRLFEPQSPMAVYSAAKAAVAGFTRSLALELADRQIRVNAVAPGMARTGDNVAAAGEAAAYVEMDDITHGVMALAVPGPTRMTGEILPIAPRAALMELAGRVALVTGAGRRLGRAMARALAGRGMTLAIHHHASARRRALRDEIVAAGGRAACFAADLTDAAAARRAAAPGGRRARRGSTCWSIRPR